MQIYKRSDIQSRECDYLQCVSPDVCVSTLRWYIKRERFLYLLHCLQRHESQGIILLCAWLFKTSGMRGERESCGGWNIISQPEVCSAYPCSSALAAGSLLKALRQWGWALGGTLSPSQSHTPPAAVLNDSHLHHLPCLLQVYFGPGQVTLFHCTREWGWCRIPAPTTLSMAIQDASSSLANSCTAWLGSSYVCGST